MNLLYLIYICVNGWNLVMVVALDIVSVLKTEESFNYPDIYVYAFIGV